MSDPVEPFVPSFLNHLKEVPKHFPIAALADRSVEYGRHLIEHVPDHYLLLHTMVEAVHHVPSPVIWACCFAGTMALEVLYHDAMDGFYRRVAHHAHKALHLLPGGAAAAEAVRGHHAAVKGHLKRTSRHVAHHARHIARSLGGPISMNGLA